MIAADEWHMAWEHPRTGHIVYADRDEADGTWSVHSQTGGYSASRMKGGLTREGAKQYAGEITKGSLGGTDITGGL
jgi:hypothetical protein